jgi:hypothetical protein
VSLLTDETLVERDGGYGAGANLQEEHCAVGGEPAKLPPCKTHSVAV